MLKAKSNNRNNANTWGLFGVVNKLKAKCGKPKAITRLTNLRILGHSENSLILKILIKTWV